MRTLQSMIYLTVSVVKLLETKSKKELMIEKVDVE